MTSAPTPPAIAASAEVLELTVDITKTAIAARAISAAETPGFIATVGAALQAVASRNAPTIDAATSPIPAVDPKKSVKRDHILSLIDGRPYKMLRRHLVTHGYTPDAYRKAFGLPADYPMVAASYIERRRQIAVDIGLGRPSVTAH